MAITTKFIPPNQLNTAILFLVFNRLNATKKVFKAIQQARPPRLYIAADGAREDKDGENEKVTAVRDFIIKNIDWDCEIKTLFQKKNNGCGPNIKLSIDWFFANEEIGIILEDDCVPKQSFFYYCEELLIKYQNDNRIGMISGTNHVGDDFIQDSYTFSQYKACWGWATWKRSWEYMDFEMNCLNSDSKDIIIKNMGYGKSSIKHWNNAIKKIQSNLVNTWDWQWYFSIASQGQLCIFPKCNMIANIGFDKNATHTSCLANKIFLETQDLSFPIQHPKYILINSLFDKTFENKKIKSYKRFILKKIKNILKKILYRIDNEF